MDDAALTTRHRARRVADMLIDLVFDPDTENGEEQIEVSQIPALVDSLDLSDEEKDMVLSEVSKQIDDLTADLDNIDQLTDTVAKEQEKDISDVEEDLDKIDDMADKKAMEPVEKDMKSEPVTVSKESVTVGDDEPHDEMYADMGNLFSTISSLR